MKIQIDTLAYTNRLRWLPTEHKLIFATTLFVIALLSHPPVQIVIAVWLSVWTVLYARIPAKVYFSLVYFALFFWLSSLLALAINGVDITQLSRVRHDSLGGFNFANFYIYISYQGIIQGLIILARSLASLSCLYFIMLTVPFIELLHLLRRLGMPELLTELLLLMYRFIFVLLNTAGELWTAQQARFGYRTFKTSMKSLGLLVGQLFKRTIDNYHQMSLSVESRGFNGKFQFWYPCQYQPSLRYAIEAIIGCLLLIGWELFNNARIFTGV